MKQYAPLDTNYYLQVAFSSLLTFMFPILRAILSAQRLIKKKKSTDGEKETSLIKEISVHLLSNDLDDKGGVAKRGGLTGGREFVLYSPLGVCKFI